MVARAGFGQLRLSRKFDFCERFLRPGFSKGSTTTFLQPNVGNRQIYPVSDRDNYSIALPDLTSREGVQEKRRGMEWKGK